MVYNTNGIKYIRSPVSHKMTSLLPCSQSEEPQQATCNMSNYSKVSFIKIIEESITLEGSHF